MIKLLERGKNPMIVGVGFQKKKGKTNIENGI